MTSVLGPVQFASNLRTNPITPRRKPCKFLTKASPNDDPDLMRALWRVQVRHENSTYTIGFVVGAFVKHSTFVQECLESLSSCNFPRWVPTAKL